jgi:SAM-dependent methyltransferase
MNKTKNTDIFGKALIDYQNGNYTEDIITHSSLAGKDVMELPYLFRTFDEMPEIEQKALELSWGSVLDIGCGAGSHSLILQNKNLEITSIDVSKGAIETCQLRGIKNAKVQDIWKLKRQKYDTILALMNGIGICGNLKNLIKFLRHLKSLLQPNGQILIDSSDILYMYEDDDGTYEIPEKGYYGEVIYQFEYKKEKSKPFPWIFVDLESLTYYAKKAGLHCELVLEGTHADYLARLTIV